VPLIDLIYSKTHLTSIKFSSGNGLPYMPSDVSVVVANISRVTQVKHSVTEVSGGLSGLLPILTFDKEVKDRLEDVSKGCILLLHIH